MQKLDPWDRITDAWLQSNDPEYEVSRRTWPHLGEAFTTPSQELSAGGSTEVDEFCETRVREKRNSQGQRQARGVAMTRPIVVERRACENPRCPRDPLFVPVTPWQRFCSETCQQAVAKRRQRAKRPARV